jgi:hypothetical protein
MIRKQYNVNDDNNKMNGESLESARRDFFIRQSIDYHNKWIVSSFAHIHTLRTLHVRSLSQYYWNDDDDERYAVWGGMRTLTSIVRTLIDTSLMLHHLSTSRLFFLIHVTQWMPQIFEAEKMEKMNGSNRKSFSIASTLKLCHLGFISEIC